MSKKMKLALLALLGFSTACSTVKNGSKGEEKSKISDELVTPGEEKADDRPQIRVLYGVRPPVPLEESEQAPASDNVSAEQK